MTHVTLRVTVMSRWHGNVGDFKFVTIFECWSKNFDIGELFWKLIMVIKLAKNVTNIIKLSATHFVSKIGHSNFNKFLNSYWTILENSSRNFSEVSVFRSVTQTDFWKTHSYSLNIISRLNALFWMSFPEIRIWIKLNRWPLI